MSMHNDEDQMTSSEGQAYREYAWALMLSQVGTHRMNPERDTIGRVKMDYSNRRATQNSATTPFNNFG